VNPVLVALATKRLTQLAVEDELTRPVREWIDRWAGDAPEFSFRDRVATLTSCSACMSVWMGAGILLAGRCSLGRLAIRVLAASASALAIDAVLERLER
jgi:hypothetical protein